MSLLTSVSAPRNISTTTNIDAPPTVQMCVPSPLRHLLDSAWLRAVVERTDLTSFFAIRLNALTKNHIPTWRAHVTSSTVIPLFQKSRGDEFGFLIPEIGVQVEELRRRLGGVYLRRC